MGGADAYLVTYAVGLAVLQKGARPMAKDVEAGGVLSPVRVPKKGKGVLCMPATIPPRPRTSSCSVIFSASRRSGGREILSRVMWKGGDFCGIEVERVLVEVG